MKAKYKRSASEYEESLSSQDSCYDSIATQIQASSFITSSPASFASIKNPCNNRADCRTPPRIRIEVEKSYSCKRMDSINTNGWERDNQAQVGQSGNWVFESEDSKIRKKQGNYSQLIKSGYKQHAKALKFQNEDSHYEADKENMPMCVNLDNFSEEEENNEFWEIRRKNKRLVGKLLFAEKCKLTEFNPELPKIVEEDSISFTQINNSGGERIKQRVKSKV